MCYEFKYNGNDTTRIFEFVYQDAVYYELNEVPQKDTITRMLWYSDWQHNTTSAVNSIFVTNQIIRPEESFQLFGGQIYFYFTTYATGLLKNWKKQHFILCSNLTLFIVPFFLSFFLFFLFYLFYLFFLSFFFFLGGGRGEGDGPCPSQMTPLYQNIP